MGDSSGTTTNIQDLPSWLHPYAENFLSAYSDLSMPGTNQPRGGGSTGAGQPHMLTYDEWWDASGGGSGRGGLPAYGQYMKDFNSGGLAQVPNPLSSSSIRQYDPSLNQQVAGFSPNQLAAIEQMRATGQDITPLLQNAQQQLGSTLAGDYLSPESNPYLKSAYEQAARGVTDQYRTATAPTLAAMSQRVGGGGLPGGSAYQQAGMQQQYGLGRNLSDLATQLYGGNYETERGRQLGAMQMAPGMAQAQYLPAEQLMQAGTLEQEQQQLMYDTLFQNMNRADQYQFNVMNQLATALGASQGGAGSGQSSQKK